MRGAFISGSHLKTTPIGTALHITERERHLRLGCRKKEMKDEEVLEYAWKCIHP